MMLALRIRNIALPVAAALAGLPFSLTALGDGASPVLLGRVIKIVDGDTLDVKLSSGPIRVRLYAVDVPEKNQPHGAESTAALAQMVSNKDVKIEPINQDRYDRLVGVVYIGELNVNAELIRRGLAWGYRRYMRRVDAQLCNYEAEARRSNRGLWAASDDELEAPWEWRNRKLKWVTDFSQETAADCLASIGRRE